MITIAFISLLILFYVFGVLELAVTNNKNINTRFFSFLKEEYERLIPNTKFNIFVILKILAFSIITILLFRENIYITIFVLISLLIGLFDFITAIRYDSGVIPDIYILILIIVGLFYNINNALISLVFFITFYMIIFLYYKLRGLVILGGGDIKYISVIVLFFNIKVALLTLFIASVISIPFFFFKRNKELLMPFGPFLVTAILIILLFPEPISNLFFSLYKVSL